MYILILKFMQGKKNQLGTSNVYETVYNKFSSFGEEKHFYRAKTFFKFN